VPESIIKTLFRVRRVAKGDEMQDLHIVKAVRTVHQSLHQVLRLCTSCSEKDLGPSFHSAESSIQARFSFLEDLLPERRAHTSSIPDFFCCIDKITNEKGHEPSQP
jgi:hypothetical protein